MPTTRKEAILCQSDSMDVLFNALLERVESHKASIPVITGPTGSGKSHLAMMLAERIKGEIVSCDAMQVYRGFDIGTAKPTKEDQRVIPHHMIDILDPCETMSVASYVSEVTDLLHRLLKDHKRPILCGGSVQYVSALLDGLRFIGDPPDAALREEVAMAVEEKGLEASWKAIERLDPKSAAVIAPTDRTRMVRFFEIYRQTGLLKSEINLRSREGEAPFNYLPFWLDWTPRAALYGAINDRVDRMFQAGLVSEVKKLSDKVPHMSECPAFRGIGYKEVLGHLEGQYSEVEARHRIAQSTRRYAKRQQTWLRKRKDLQILLIHR